MSRLIRWLRGLFTRRPRQLLLPFWCGHYGQRCRYIHNSTTGFYGRCMYCGHVYDPGCDR